MSRTLPGSIAAHAFATLRRWAINGPKPSREPGSRASQNPAMVSPGGVFCEGIVISYHPT